jgi:hypothetical protein
MAPSGGGGGGGGAAWRAAFAETAAPNEAKGPQDRHGNASGRKRAAG